MKNLILLLSVLLSTIAFSQEKNDSDKKSQFDDYNQWFIEFGVGGNKAGRTLTNISNPSLNIFETANTKTFSGLHADLAVRYMFNDKFGLRLKGGYNDISENEDESTFEFNSTYIQSSLEGVLNLGSVLDFQNWTQRFNLQIYGGFGVGVLTTDFSDGEDYTATAVIGFTPMYKISDKVSLKMDFMGLANATQQFNWDGFSHTTTGSVDGLMLNSSIGLNINLGKSQKNIDWYHLEHSENAETQSLKEEINDLKNKLSDTDRDGVPDYLDNEPNTVNGVAVNTKGIAIDQNQNGVPDELEKELNKTYATKSDLNKSKTSGGSGTFKSLVEQGYVNVYFGFDKVYPEAASINDVNSVITFLKQNPNETIQLIGYTDSIGNKEYNKILSEKRSKYIKDILVSAGISESRIESIGSGVNPNIDSNTTYSRKLARKVMIKLKK
ncbi:OmpA family protein [Psychroflexus sp. MBR-150]|jgi:OOP family OmpA-OmpF porin